MRNHNLLILSIIFFILGFLFYTPTTTVIYAQADNIQKDSVDIPAVNYLATATPIPPINPEPTISLSLYMKHNRVIEGILPSPTDTPVPSPTVTKKPNPTITQSYSKSNNNTGINQNPNLTSPYTGLIQKYAGEYGVDAGKMERMAKCESTYNPNARSGIYGGLYQFSPATWRSTRISMGLDPNPDLRFNAEEAIRTTAFKISKGGLGAWPVCGKR